MSAFPPEADLAVRVQIVRKVPEADISLQPAGNLWPMKRVVPEAATKLPEQEWQRLIVS